MFEGDFSHELEDFNLGNNLFHDVERKAIAILRDKYKKENNLTEEQLQNEMVGAGFEDPKDFFVDKFSYEEVDKIYRDVEQQLRQDYISRMKFEQQYKDERHIGDLKFAQREMDASYGVGMQENLRSISRTGETITKDMQEVNVKKIFDAYINLATQYNIEDYDALKKIIDKSEKNPQQGIFINDFADLINDNSKKNEFNNLFKDSEDKLKTFEMAISLGEKNNEKMLSAIKNKTDLLEYFSKKFPDMMNEFHSSNINELNSSILRTQNQIAPPETIQLLVESSLKKGTTKQDVLDSRQEETKRNKGELENEL
jgi:hypothetical protein